MFPPLGPRHSCPGGGQSKKRPTGAMCIGEMGDPSVVRYLYILSDRAGVRTTLRSRPMPTAVRGVRIQHIGTYEDDKLAWEHFRAAQWVVEIAGRLIFPPVS